ncbi:MAG: phenylalanine--tRNA ligase subunit beta, partial [Kiritimatiellia bacterium]|nr:phenylalanine--tRNA ligase subunit beta [Kiritimatiellia bacterium]
MRVSMEWLKDYVDIEDSPNQVADRLTFSGVEVEGIEPFGADLTGLVVAEVREVSRHPNADRLTVCRVWDGLGEKQVVCGAPNVRMGGHYPFAPVGVTLPGGAKIRPAQLRGVDSEGMLCAEDELGISTDHAGLMELPATLAAGTPLDTALGRPDTVLDLEITPNRPDCLSLMGIARELAVLYHLPLKRPTVAFTESGDAMDTMARVTVEAPDLCPRYLARVITGLTHAAAPEWMRRRLRAAGIRPIRLIVDVTNYVLLECGHPLHAFDLDRLHKNQIRVRRASVGERMRTLDDVERELQPDMLVIADAEKAVAVAGVMGGSGSEIREDTRRVLLESACFFPGSIRRTARKLALNTESSHRFARGTDADTADWASRRAASLLQSLSGASVAMGSIDARAPAAPPVTVTCRWSSFARALGEPADPEDISKTLSALELEPLRRDDEGAA